MEEKLIKKTTLENGLCLHMIDRSRRIAADRYYLCLVARIEIPVSKYLEEEDVISILGENIVFEQKNDRNFVDEKDRENLFKSMLESLQSNIVQYYANKDFPKRFILKEYAAEKKKRMLFKR